MDYSPQKNKPPQKFVFFTLRSFDIDVGETLRIYGILNALSIAGYEVVLISNAAQFDSFHPAIRHIAIGRLFTGKRLLQGLMSITTASFVRLVFKKTFERIAAAIEQANAADQLLFFFDYLDNTIAYILKRTADIKRYANDVHGIATAEFLSNRLQTNNLFAKGYFHIKYWLADRLDKKVFEYADGFLFGSSMMREYFNKAYHIANKKSLVLPYLLDAYSLEREPNQLYMDHAVKALMTGPEGFIFMFAGSYKATAGVDNLITAFNELYERHKSCRLILIGDGAHRQRCEKEAQMLPASEAILFLDPVPYKLLPAYYALAHVIVCPDIDNPFSQYVVHIKYLDALATGKLVINGAFKSVLEINDGRPLSLLFDPADPQTLNNTLQNAYCNYAALKETYSDSAERVRRQFTYAAYTDALCGMNSSAT